LEFVPDAFQANARLAAYAAINCLVVQQRILAEYYGMAPDMLLVWLVICLAAAQKVIREPVPADNVRVFAEMPLERYGSISRRAVSAATGLPRETVRRIIVDLIARGMVTPLGRNGVTALTGTTPLEQRPTRKYIDAAVQMADTLFRLGVLELRTR
jgi:hypothetical protein